MCVQHLAAVIKSSNSISESTIRCVIDSSPHWYIVQQIEDVAHVRRSLRLPVRCS